ncbi:MAG: hypothetical protein Q4F00_07900 [bacterium]|nr:hypothetical protein [bacterium]
MKSEREELRNIVDRADIAGDWKKLLSEAFQALGSRSDSLLEEIGRRVEREVANLRTGWNQEWNIVTVLADCGREVSGFYPIDRTGEADAEEDLLGEAQYIDMGGTYFLDCSYAEAEALCSAEYADTCPYSGSLEVQGEKLAFRYRLVHDLRCIEAERLLFDVADIYRISKPVVFSPYSRRAVKIQIPRQDSRAADVLRELPEDDLTPYCLPDNKLAGRLLAGKKLLWNLRLGELELPQYQPGGECSTSYASPYRDSITYGYEFKEQRNCDFVSPDADDIVSLIDAEKDGERELITLRAQKLLVNKCRFLRIIRAEDNIADYRRKVSGAVFFRNYADPLSVPAEMSSVWAKERLRTRGDIERVLGSLRMSELDLQGEFVAVEAAAKKGFQVCQRYARELSYGEASCSQREQALYKKWRSLPFCYIRFSGNAKFLSDYAEYVLFYLENRYPDFQWVGVL